MHFSLLLTSAQPIIGPQGDVPKPQTARQDFSASRQYIIYYFTLYAFNGVI